VIARDSAFVQALAYVDDCLPPAQRRDFERRLAREPELAALVEGWRLQNEAIRTVLSEEGGREPRPSGNPASPAPPLHRDRERRRALGEPIGLAAQSVRVHALRQGRLEQRRSTFGRGSIARAFGALLSALGILAVSATPAPVDHTALLALAAFSAYRTFAGDGPGGGFKGDQPAALEQWLRPQLGGFARIPDFAPAGYALIGGRIISGAQGPAAFALYAARSGARIGLTFELGESLPASELSRRTSGDLAAITLAAPGLGDWTIVGKADTPGLERLARLLGPASP
jgi:anti-sigma factor RsiW